MSRFEVKDVFLSNAILDKDLFVPYKILNLSVRVNMEEIQDLRSRGTPHEELAKVFGKAMEEAFLEHCRHNPEDKQKVKITNLAPLRVEQAGEKEFGWYKLNENQETSNG